MDFWQEVLIYIPAYHSARHLPKVIDRLPLSAKKQAREILIIDNASSDETVQVAETLQKKYPNLRVIHNPRNEGYGGSQRIAYKRCLQGKFKAVVMLHGDGQYAPELIEEMVQPVMSGEVDVMLGSRILGHPRLGGMPWIRYLGNRVLTFIQNTLLRTHLSEFHSGYRAYAASALGAVPLSEFSSDYHFDTEILLAFLHKGFRIKEIAIPTHYGDEVSYLNVWKYGTNVLFSTLRYVLHNKKIVRSRLWTKVTGN